jgi:hypothetical protein
LWFFFGFNLDFFSHFSQENLKSVSIFPKHRRRDFSRNFYDAVRNTLEECLELLHTCKQPA